METTSVIQEFFNGLIALQDKNLLSFYGISKYIKEFKKFNSEILLNLEDQLKSHKICESNCDIECIDDLFEIVTYNGKYALECTNCYEVIVGQEMLEKLLKKVA